MHFGHQLDYSGFFFGKNKIISDNFINKKTHPEGWAFFNHQYDCRTSQKSSASADNSHSAGATIGIA